MLANHLFSEIKNKRDAEINRMQRVSRKKQPQDANHPYSFAINLSIRRVELLLFIQNVTSDPVLEITDYAENEV